MSVMSLTFSSSDSYTTSPCDITGMSMTGKDGLVWRITEKIICKLVTFEKVPCEKLP
jgi:hypothetical protein